MHVVSMIKLIDFEKLQELISRAKVEMESSKSSEDRLEVNANLQHELWKHAEEIMKYAEVGLGVELIVRGDESDMTDEYARKIYRSAKQYLDKIARVYGKQL